MKARRQDQSLCNSQPIGSGFTSIMMNLIIHGQSDHGTALHTLSLSTGGPKGADVNTHAY